MFNLTMANQDLLYLPTQKGVLTLGPKDKPYVMGILNITPDSFWDGGLYLEVPAALKRAEVMLHEGATLLDLGAASSRPKGQVYGDGASVLPIKTELARLIPVVEALVRHFPEAILSIDTYRSEVAKAALEAGADILNDITALRFDPNMATVAAQHNAPLILMHAVGLPGEMPHQLESTDILATVCTELKTAIQKARLAGVKHLMTDPGFGFGKSHAGNLALINGIPSLLALGCPVLVGISRKSTIGALLQREGIPLPPELRLFGTLGVTAVALQRGAKIIRTHDVRETKQFLELFYLTELA